MGKEMVDLQIAETLYDMMEFAGEDVAKRFLEDGRKNYSCLKDFDYYMKLHPNYKSERKKFLETMILFSKPEANIIGINPEKKYRSDDKHTLQQFTI